MGFENEKSNEKKYLEEGGNGMQKKVKTIAIITIFIIIIVIAICAIFILKKHNISVVPSYDAETKTYIVEKHNIEISSNESLSYDISTGQYSLPLTLINKGRKDYKELVLKVELYDKNGKAIKQLSETIETLRMEERREIILEFEDIETLVHNYKIINVEIKNRK